MVTFIYPCTYQNTYTLTRYLTYNYLPVFTYILQVLPVDLHVDLHVDLPVDLRLDLRLDLPVYLPIYLPIYLHVD